MLAASQPTDGMMQHLHPMFADLDPILADRLAQEIAQGPAAGLLAIPANAPIYLERPARPPMTRARAAELLKRGLRQVIASMCLEECRANKRATHAMLLSEGRPETDPAYMRAQRAADLALIRVVEACTTYDARFA